MEVVSQTERHFQMQRLIQTMRQRFGISIPGDNAYWDDVHGEARVLALDGPTEFFYTRFDAAGFQNIEACGPILHCTVHNIESLDRHDVADVDELRTFLDWAMEHHQNGQCICGSGPNWISEYTEINAADWDKLIHLQFNRSALTLLVVGFIVAWLARRR